jgi:hypothetical protein
MKLSTLHIMTLDYTTHLHYTTHLMSIKLSSVSLPPYYNYDAHNTTIFGPGLSYDTCN